MDLEQLRAIPVDRVHAVGLDAVSGSIAPREPIAKKIAIGMLGFAVPLMFGMWAISNGSTSSTAPASATPAAQELVGQTTVDNGQTLNWYTFEISDTWAGRVENEVRENLRDPDSARFTHIRSAISARGMVAVCGIVNSKNGFGGYGGNEFFIAFLSDGKVHGVQLDEDMAGIVMVTCGQMGNAR
jgi:hypothetical protein